MIGVHAALRVVLDPNLSDNALTTSKFEGFKVFNQFEINFSKKKKLN